MKLMADPGRFECSLEITLKSVLRNYLETGDVILCITEFCSCRSSRVMKCR